VRSGDFVFVAEMRGIDLANNAILGSEEKSAYGRLLRT
jgi:hypothetical protein